MNKFVALSTAAAVALTLGACGKTEDSANAADNAANEVVAVEGNFAVDNVTADNVVVADNAVDTLNAADANATNAAEANATNAN